MGVWIRLWMVAALSTLWGEGEARAQMRERPSAPIRALGEGEKIIIDAALDEPAWASAPIIDQFVQVEPVEGAKPSKRTEIRLLYDSNNLYIGIRCFADPSTIIAREMQRDGALFRSITVKTGADGKADFKIKNLRRGTYKTSATAVEASGLIWDGSTPSNTFTKK